MRKVLAVASVGCEHKELVLKDLKKIFKRIKISPDVLLQEEFNNKDASNTGSSTLLFKAYPYITLTIPNYEQHRECNSFLIKIWKKSTKTMFCSASSYYSFQRVKITRISSKTEARIFYENNAGIGMLMSVVNLTVPLLSLKWRSKLIKWIKYLVGWIFVAKLVKSMLRNVSI